MGMSPGEVDRTGFWQFMATWNGYVTANTPGNGKLSESEAEALFDWIDSAPVAGEISPMPVFSWDGERLAAFPPV